MSSPAIPPGAPPPPKKPADHFPDDQRFLCIRFAYGRPSFSIEHGDHRSWIEKREAPTSKRIPIPASWKGTLSDIIAHFKKATGAAKPPPSA